MVGDDERRLSVSGVNFSALAAMCVVAGSVSLLDAGGSAQDSLNVLHQMRLGATQTCPGQFTVPSWGDTMVIVAMGVALALLCLAALVAWGAVRWGMWGEAPALVASIPIAMLWFDAHIVGGAPIGDCDGVGLGGAASVAIDRAGWLFVASLFFSFLTWAALNTSLKQAAFGVPRMNI